MDFFLIFALLSGIVAIGSFFYKVYIQIKIKYPQKKVPILSVFIRLYNIADFLPMSTKYKDGEELGMRKKANIFLLIFYSVPILFFSISYMVERHAN
jgi:hypothetical protein